MSCKTVRVNDIGTIFRLTVLNCEDNSVVDVSSASVLQLIMKSPTGNVTQHTATFTTDGTDGVIQYVTQAGDIDVTGTWYIQAVVTMPSGTFRSSIASFEAEEVL